MFAALIMASASPATHVPGGSTSVQVPTKGEWKSCGFGHRVFTLGDQAGSANALPIVRSITAAIQVEVGAFQVQPDLPGHLLEGVQPLRQQDQIRLIDGSHGDRRSDVAMMVDDGKDLLALLVFVPRVPTASPPFLATVVVSSPCSTLVSRCFAAARCHTLAMQACQSDPSSAHVAKTLYTVVECMAGVPLGSFGTGKHFHGIPV